MPQSQSVLHSLAPAGQVGLIPLVEQLIRVSAKTSNARKYFMTGDPKGIRTPMKRVKISHPEPLDDGTVYGVTNGVRTRTE